MAKQRSVTQLSASLLDDIRALYHLRECTEQIQIRSDSYADTLFERITANIESLSKVCLSRNAGIDITHASLAFVCDTCHSPLELVGGERGVNEDPLFIDNPDGTTVRFNAGFEVGSDGELPGYTCRCSDVDIIDDPEPNPKHRVYVSFPTD